MEKSENCGSCHYWEESKNNLEKGFGICETLENICKFKYEADYDCNYFELAAILTPYWFYCSQHIWRVKNERNDY